MTGEFDFSRRIPELDGLRGVAIALVLAFHAEQGALQLGATPVISLIARPLSITWCGVDLFFVLSGFLIGGILLDARGSSGYFRCFYARRVCRIFPLYFAYLAIAAVAISARVPWELAYLQNFWMAAHNSLGNPSLEHTWSLAVEEQFYLTLPAVIYFAKPRALPKILAGGIFAAALVRIALCLFVSGSAIATAVLLPCRMDALLIGVMLAWALRYPGAMEFLRARRRQLWTAMEILTAVSALYFIHGDRYGLLTNAVVYDSLALLFACVIAASLVDPQLGRILCARWLRGLGSIAYGVYLLHPLFFNLAAAAYRGPGRAAVVIIAGLISTLVVAKLSWDYLERPLVQLGHRVSYTAAPSKADPNLAPAEAS